jgi:hypothetical protein
VSSTDTWTTVLDWLAATLLIPDLHSCTKARRNLLRDRELSQVVANHLRLDLDLVELLSGVDTDDGTNHLWDDNHVTEVSLDQIRLLVWLGLLLGLAELLDQAHRLALEAAVEAAAGSGMDDVTELVRGEVQKSAERGLA